MSGRFQYLLVMDEGAANRTLRLTGKALAFDTLFSSQGARVATPSEETSRKRGRADHASRGSGGVNSRDQQHEPAPPHLQHLSEQLGGLELTFGVRHGLAVE